MSIAVPEAPDNSGMPLVAGWLAGKRSVHTRQAYRRDITMWLEWLGEHGIHPLDVTEPDTAFWARHLEAQGLAASTVARKLSAISSWYRWLARNGHVTGNPAEKLSRPEVDRDQSTTPGLTRDQALALLHAADTAPGPQRLRTSAMAALLLFTGVRVSGAAGADVEDIGLDRNHRVLWVTRKGGARQPLVLPSPVAERVDRYLASREDISSLPAVPGQPGAPRPRRALLVTNTGKRLHRQNITHEMHRLAALAGLPPELSRRAGAHAARHTFATLYLDAGGSERDLQDAMGHKDPRTTRRYDRARYSLDRSPGYLLASYLSETGSQ